MDGKRILVVDDSPEIREIVEVLLTGEGYDVLTATNGQEAVNMVDESIDLIILDIIMPKKSGFRACLEIREKSTAPILFLTAKSEDSDKIMGFSSGADDYLSKPFSYPELISRVKSLLRRYYVYQGKPNIVLANNLSVRGLNVDTDSKVVTIEGTLIDLTDIEYKILLLMLQYRKKIFSAENLYETIWEEPYFYTANNTIMVHIRNLRKKIENDPQNPDYIKTAWGKGYYIE